MKNNLQVGRTVFFILSIVITSLSSFTGRCAGNDFHRMVITDTFPVKVSTEGLPANESLGSAKSPVLEPLISDTVDVEASYPGGSSGWYRHLNRTFRYPQNAQVRGITGTVLTVFIVDEKGRVREVRAVTGPEKGGLRKEAERVIKESGRWIPAIKNGTPVKSYQQMTVTFKLESV